MVKWYDGMRRHHRPGTIELYAVKLRRLYEFTLIKQGVSKRAARLRAEKLFEAVPLSQLRRARRDNGLREKLITPEELNRLLEAADHPRARALLAVLYESGARIGEVLSVRIRDVELRSQYALMRVSGKTGVRGIPLCRSLPYLEAWLRAHPRRKDPDSPLWLRRYNGGLGLLTPSAVRMMLRRLVKRAGISRHVHPHMLRHTRLTELASKQLGEFQLKSFAGWTTDSRMAGRYLHLTGRRTFRPS